MGIGSLRRYHAPQASSKRATKLEPGSLVGQGTPEEVHAAVDAANAAKVAAEQRSQAEAAAAANAGSVYPTIQAKGRRRTTAQGKVTAAAESEAEVEGQPATGDEGTSQAQAAADGSEETTAPEETPSGSDGAETPAEPQSDDTK